jgi:hypothetical protein
VIVSMRLVMKTGASDIASVSEKSCVVPQHLVATDGVYCPCSVELPFIK